jgi:hypothetical protein
MGDAPKQYKYGTFSAPSYISIGDPYVKKGVRRVAAAAQPRWASARPYLRLQACRCLLPEQKIGCEARAGNGRQFQTQPQKRGQTVDNWGAKKSGWFKPLYEVRERHQYDAAHSALAPPPPPHPRSLCLSPSPHSRAGCAE